MTQTTTPDRRPHTVVLLGAQRFNPTLGDVVKTTGVHGKMALITAGWQERELEDEELSAHLGGDTVNLRLHARGVELFAKDPELAKAHRERQVLLRQLQDIYRIRLDHAQAADFEVSHYPMPERMRDEMRATSIEGIKALDAWHLEKCTTVRSEFETRMKTIERPEVQKHREELAAALEGCAGVCIAGGHVAVLVNRLTMFGMGDLFGERAVFAWTAGAMAVTDRIILFHDDPPQGQVAEQVLDEGLGLVPRTIAFPTPERRLHLDNAENIQLIARRFAPATCLVLPDRSWVIWNGESFGKTQDVALMTETGATVPFGPVRRG
jgi:hypothetical protein